MDIRKGSFNGLKKMGLAFAVTAMALGASSVAMAEDIPGVSTSEDIAQAILAAVQGTQQNTVGLTAFYAGYSPEAVKTFMENGYWRSQLQACGSTANPCPTTSMITQIDNELSPYFSENAANLKTQNTEDSASILHLMLLNSNAYEGDATPIDLSGLLSFGVPGKDFHMPSTWEKDFESNFGLASENLTMKSAVLHVTSELPLKYSASVGTGYGNTDDKTPYDVSRLEQHGDEYSSDLQKKAAQLFINYAVGSATKLKLPTFLKQAPSKLEATGEAGTLSETNASYLVALRNHLADMSVAIDNLENEYAQHLPTIPISSTEKVSPLAFEKQISTGRLTDGKKWLTFIQNAPTPELQRQMAIMQAQQLYEMHLINEQLMRITRTLSVMDVAMLQSNKTSGLDMMVDKDGQTQEGGLDSAIPSM